MTTRRQFLSTTTAGLFGLSLSELLAARSASAAAAPQPSGFGQAQSCIVLFAWGGMSHLDTWDMKPYGGSDIRGEFHPIATRTPGLHLCEHMPEIASRSDKLAIVRSVHHQASDHREAAYWNLTGHRPRQLGQPAIEPSREDWPSLGSMVAFAHQANAKRSVLPGTVSIPYPIADRGLLNGQYAGILGNRFEPIYVKPRHGTPFDGVSPASDALRLDPHPDVPPARLAARDRLLTSFDAANAHLLHNEAVRASTDQNERAIDMVRSSAVREAFDLEREPANMRAAYGEHICGTSVLLARRLTGAGVPLATVYCSAGDLNGSVGAHWDTHGDGFNRLRRDLLPPLDRASGALLDDLTASGRLDETLVVWLTEFGRTPQMTGTGRNHFPNCYSVAFAGAGIGAGQVYGKSDKSGSAPAEKPCGPEELHATILHALGIDPHTTFLDLQGRPRYLCEAEPLPLG